MKRTTASQTEVWRFQRDRIYADVISGMAKDRRSSHFVTRAGEPMLYAALAQRMGGRPTIYLHVIRTASTVRLLGEVDGW
jgi:hypothetical protein